MKSIVEFWSVFPILLLFLFHTQILNFFGIPMAYTRGRSNLVKNLVSKMEQDQKLEEFDKSKWYSVNLENIKSSEIKSKFVQLEADTETQSFIDDSVAQSDWLFTQIWYNVAKSVLSWFYCQTDINGMLQRGSMFVFSKEQFLKMTNLQTDNRLETMLDLGAGDGRPTLSMSEICDKVFATEMSSPMRNILGSKGFEVLEINEWPGEAKYDLISALNLFDRCDKPLSIISDVYSSLKEGGFFIVALVLPFRPYVESVASHKPSEAMNIEGEAFEHQVETAIVLFEKIGFKLQSWSRVPYLCEGDLARPIYQLNNALFVFRKS